MLLGERLYRLIERTQPQLTGKITGMFLDSGWSIEELFSLTQDEAKLAAARSDPRARLLLVFLEGLDEAVDRG